MKLESLRAPDTTLGRAGRTSSPVKSFERSSERPPVRKGARTTGHPPPPFGGRGGISRMLEKSSVFKDLIAPPSREGPETGAS